MYIFYFSGGKWPVYPPPHSIPNLWIKYSITNFVTQSHSHTHTYSLWRMKFVLMQNFSIKSNLFMYVCVLQINCTTNGTGIARRREEKRRDESNKKEMKNFRVKSTRSIRHVILISKSQHTHSEKRRIKNFFDFMYFFLSLSSASLVLQILIYFSSFFRFHTEKLFSLTVEICSHESIFSMWIFAWLACMLATIIKSSIYLLWVRVVPRPLPLPSHTLSQCNLKQFHLVFNYIIFLLHIYWMIQPPPKWKTWKVCSARRQIVHVDVNIKRKKMKSFNLSFLHEIMKLCPKKRRRQKVPINSHFVFEMNEINSCGGFAYLHLIKLKLKQFPWHTTSANTWAELFVTSIDRKSCTQW